MKFCKLVRYDVINGIWHRFYHYIILILLGGIFYVDFYRKVIWFTEVTGGRERATITNFFFYFFEGRKPFDPNLEPSFVFPVVWIIIFLYAAYITLDYPFHNLTENGTQVIFRVGSRRMWWLSKCLWVTFSTILYFAILYLIPLILSLFLHIDISLSYSQDMNKSILGMEFEIVPNNCQIVMMIFVLPVLTALAVNFMELCLELFFKRIYAFIAAAVLLFASSYFFSPVVIGNYAMMKRSIFCETEGMTIETGVIVNGLLILLTIIIGYIYIKRYDIIRKEEGEMV